MTESFPEPMTRVELRDHLIRMCACRESLEWYDAAPGEPTHLWIACPRIAWLFWCAIRAGVDIRSIVLAACDCARFALPFIPDETERADSCTRIETAEAWTRGEATLEQVRAAADAAADTVSYATHATTAIHSAAYATVAAAYAADAAHSAAADTVAAHAAAAATAAARQVTYRTCANIVRSRIPWSLIETALRKETR